jgi:hypothetical protein
MLNIIFKSLQSHVELLHFWHFFSTDLEDIDHIIEYDIFPAIKHSFF